MEFKAGRLTSKVLTPQVTASRNGHVEIKEVWIWKYT